MNSNRGMLCLIFAVREGELEYTGELKRSEVQGYALLPPISCNSKIFKVFQKNDVHIISEDLDCSPLLDALVDNHVEIIQVLLDDVSETKACTSQTSSCLKFCVEKGNKKIIDILLGNNAVYHKTNLNFSGFRSTVSGKNLKLIKNLMQCNPNIRFRHPAGGTLLHLAVIRGHKPLVRLLLDHGADVGAKRSNFSTPLHLAALKGNLQIVKLLLKHGASVNARRNDGSTCLHIAAFKGHVQVHKLLLQHGAKAQAQRHDGSTALHSAAKKGHVKIVKDLLQVGGCVNSTIKNDSLSSPMYFAIQKGHAQVVHLLLRYGVKVNTRYGGLSILEQAVNKGRADVVEAVLNHRPDLNNKHNRKALRQAVTLDNGKRVVEKLLRYGFLLDADCKNDPSLLHEAVRKNYSGIVTQLLNYGANINELYSAVERDKYAPLHTAARYSNENMIRLLLDRGADIYVLSDYKKEPFTVAVAHANEKAVEVFIEKGVNVHDYHSILFDAIETGNTAIVETLVRNGADIHSNYPSTAPLVIAARRGDLEMVKVLLQLGAKVDSGSLGETALHGKIRLDIIEYLIQNGANVNAVTFHGGTTPLLNAASDGDCARLEILLKFGADMHIIDREGRSVLREACMWGEDPKPLQLLLDYGFTDVTLLTDTYICDEFDLDSIDDDDEDLMHFYHVESENFKKAAVILAKHMLKMDSAGLYYGEENQMPTWYCKEISMSDYQRNCQAEVASLRSTKIANSNVSYFDVVTSDVHHLTCFARNVEIIHALKSTELSTTFPLYASILTCQLQKGIHRREFLDQGIKTCHSLFRFFRELPRLLKEKILNYLSNQDIKILVGACTPCSS